MALSSILSGLVSGGAKGIVNGIAEAADRFIQTDEEKQRFALEAEKIVTERLREVEQSARDTVDARMKVVVAELQSGDKYVSRTRPMIARVGLYVIIANYVVVPMVSRLCAAITFDGQDIVTPLIGPFELPTEFWFAWGGIVGTYAIGRSFEKTTGANNISKWFTGSKSISEREF